MTSKRVIPLALLVGCCGLILLERLYTYHQPLEWDLATYTLVARQLLLGQKLYVDVWDIKPPGIFAVHAIAQGICGDGLFTIFLLSSVVAVGTCIAIYLSLARVNRFAAVIGCAVFSVVSADLLLEANRANTEAYINLLLAISIACMLHAKRTRTLIFAGFLIGLATLFKQVAIVYLAALFFAPTIARTKWKRVLPLLGPVAILWALVFGYCSLTGRFHIAWITFIIAPRAYGGNVSDQFRLLIQIFRSSQLVSLLPMTVMTGLAILLSSKHRSMLLALLVTSVVAIALPGHLWSHYLQLLIVPLSLGTGYGVIALLECSSKKLAYATGIIAVVGLIILQAPSYQLPVSQWTERQNGGGYIILQDAIAPLQKLLKDDETFFVWGDEPWMYHRLNRQLPTGMVFRSHVVDSPVEDELSKVVLAQLQKHPPDLLLIREGRGGPENHPIWRWLMEHYRPLPYDGKNYPLLQRYAHENSDLLMRAGDRRS